MPFIDFDGNTRELAPGETLVGSGSQASWRLPSADLAARHFTVTHGAGGETTIKSYSPQNIVTVNGRSMGADPVALNHGDVIAAGSARMVYLTSLEGDRPDMAAAAGGAPLLVNEKDREVYPLTRRTVSIGRDAASHILVRDPSVSRFHADVRAEAGQYVLYSQGSTGTKINGHRAAGPQVLQEGDSLEIGETVLKFSRIAPPAGFQVVSGGADDDKMTRRATTVQNAVTGDHEGVSDEPTKLPIVPILVALFVIAIALVIIF